MHRSAVLHRRTASAAALQDTPPPAEEPPTAALAVARPIEVVEVVGFRVGDYEVGAGFCPHLCGHPGIRY